MQNTISKCFDTMRQSSSTEFKKDYAKGLRAFVDAYPDIDACSCAAQQIYRILGSDIDSSRAREAALSFHELCKDRKTRIAKDRSWLFPLTPVPMLSLDNGDHWASPSQIASGRVLQDILSEHGKHVPEFVAICLNPTAGIAGPGNVKLFDTLPGTVMSVHAAIHDSYGYARLYHGVGPGYNYINSWFDPFPTTSPRSGQLSGLWHCYRHKYA